MYLIDNGFGPFTQFGRALRELGITHVLAHNPEAKGRVERANGTFQDRLVAELRLSGASTVMEAKVVLWDFLSRFNERFGVPAAQPGQTYRPISLGLDLEGILCVKEWRRVARDNTVQYRRTHRPWRLHSELKQKTFRIIPLCGKSHRT